MPLQLLYTYKHWFSFATHPWLIQLLGSIKEKVGRKAVLNFLYKYCGRTGKGLMSKCEWYCKTEKALPQFTVAPHPLLKGYIGSEISPVSPVYRHHSPGSPHLLS